MEAKLQYEMTILPSICDLEMKLSLADVFGQFMDIAAAHAQQLGVGADAMFARGLFWLTVKTKVHILRRPRMLETVTLSTRPIAPDKVRSIREYRMEQGGELLIEGKTEWTVIETASGRIHPMADVFPAGVELAAAPRYEAPFCRINPDFSDAERLGSCRVRSTDIDLGGHMNNVAYLRAVLGLLDSKALKALPQREIDVIFRAPCFEGEELTVLRRITDTGWALCVRKPDGSPAVLIRAGAGWICAPTTVLPRWILCLAFGGLGGVAAQLGDLFASMVKRHCDIKDFSQVFPGHGGMMDRLDSVFFSTVIVYVYYIFYMGI